MKVNNDLHNILPIVDGQNQQNKTAQIPQTQAEFADLLARADSALSTTEQNLIENGLFSADNSYKDISATNLATINAMLSGKLEGTKADETMQDFEKEIYNIAAALDGLDAYAEKLTQQSTDKSAWQDLQNVIGQVNDLRKSNLPSELDSIVSEIELIASTEQIKMNRGDYEI